MPLCSDKILKEIINVLSVFLSLHSFFNELKVSLKYQQINCTVLFRIIYRITMAIICHYYYGKN